MKNHACLIVLALVVLPPAAAAPPSPSAAARPVVWMCPPQHDGGRCLRELFERPDQWKETRAAIDVLGYADHNLDRQFTDDELRAWLPKLQQ
jgi:hypothetical protein